MKKALFALACAAMLPNFAMAQDAEAEPQLCDGGAVMYRVPLMTDEKTGEINVAFGKLTLETIAGEPLYDVVCITGNKDVWVLEIAGYPRLETRAQLEAMLTFAAEYGDDQYLAGEAAAEKQAELLAAGGQG